MECFSNPDTVRKMMETIKNNKIRAAELWKGEQIKMMNEIYEKEKENYDREKERVLSEAKDFLKYELIAQCEQVLESNPKEVDNYMSVNPDKANELKELLASSKSIVHKKKPILNYRQRIPQSSFEDEFPAVLSMLSDFGENLNNLTIFAENSFIIKGKVYSIGDPVSVNTRMGLPLMGNLYYSSESEIVLIFKDKGRLIIPTKDISSGKVSFM